MSCGYDAFTAGVNYGRGKRTSMSDGSGSTTWLYGDVRRRLTKETKTITGGGTFVTEWAYDQANQLTWMRYPDGEQVTTSYLRQKLVNGVSGSSLYVQSTQYNAVGRVELRALGSDQVRIDPHYHPWTTQGGRMHWLVGRVGSSGAYLQALECAYDAAGNVVRIVDTVSAGGVQTHSFSYDSMDRLLSAGAAPAGDGGDYSESYSYDSAGRLVNGPRGSNYVYADAAHKHAVTAVSGGHSYTYDANGNLTSRTTGGQSFTLTYDAENRLVGVSGAASAAFVYDGDGRRVKGTVNGVTTYYVGDHYEVSGGVVKKYYTAGGRRIAMRSGGTLYWLLNDHLGGTAHTVSGTTETGEVRYRAFGVTRFTSGTTPTSYRFTGQREEAALGLYFYNARWYDPALGHFLSPDALVPEAGNALDYHRYAYVRFNPLKYEDGSGHCATLANGQADENDAECWRLARTIANLWNDTDYWRTRFGELDVWNNHIAPSAVTAEFMQDEFDRYLQSDVYKTWVAAHHPMGGSNFGGSLDWGDYSSISLAPGIFEIALIVDDYGHWYLQGSTGAAGRGFSVTRGDLLAPKTTGGKSDIDSIGLTEMEKTRLAPTLLIGPSIDASAGFMFLGLGGSLSLSDMNITNAEGGFVSGRGFSFSLQASYTIQIYPDFRVK